MRTKPARVSSKDAEVPGRMKKMICLLLVCLLATGAAAGFAEAVSPPIILYAGEQAMLVDASGREIVPRGEYSALIDLNTAAASGEDLRFAAGKETDSGLLFALIDGEGKALTECEFELLTDYEDGIICQQDGLFGLLDRDGTVRIAPAYTSLVPNGAGGLLALKTDCWDDQPDGVYYIDAYGVESATGVKTLYLFDSAFAEGRLPLLSAENNRYGYVDAKGQWLVRPQFSFAMEYENGYAIASISSGYGVIDTEGNWVLTPRYSLVWRCQGLFVATDNGSNCVAYDSATLEERFRVKGTNLYAYDDGDCVVVTDDDSTRLYSQDGELRFTAPASAMLYATETGLFIAQDGPWGSPTASLYAADGSLLAEGFQDIFPLACIDGEEYLCYMTMDAQPGASEDDLWDYDPYTIRYGLMDAQGNKISEAIFRELQIGNDGVSLVAATDESCGLIDTDGKWIAEWTLGE